MKNIKKLLLLLPLVSLTGCSSIKSYSQFLNELRKKGDTFEFYNENEDGYKFVCSFISSEDKVTLEATMSDDSSYAEITLPLANGDTAPATYPCTYSLGVDKENVKTATFTLENERYNANRTITLDSAEFEVNDEVIKGLQDGVIGLVCALNVWALKNYTVSLTTLNIFPTFQYSTVLLEYN